MCQSCKTLYPDGEIPPAVCVFKVGKPVDLGFGPMQAICGGTLKPVDCLVCLDHPDGVLLGDGTRMPCARQHPKPQAQA